MTRRDWLVLCALPTLQAKLRTGGEVTLAAIGDSITFICFHTDYRRNYLTFVADALRKQYPAAKVRLSVSGNRGTTRLGLGFLDALLEEKPDLVFVMFGMNDCAGGLARIADYDRNLTEYIRRIRLSGATPVVLTQNQIVYDSADGKKRSALADYARRAVEVARREKADIVDNFADWSALLKNDPDWKLYLNDAIHPNLAGHRRFTRLILRDLWPEAAHLHDAALRPHLSSDMRHAAPCLLGGPAAAQVLRVGDGTWFVLSGRARGGARTDLVLSVCHGGSEPAWSDFRHYTLVGPGPDSLFPWAEREINSGMLLEGSGRVFIAFSQTVRIQLLTIDTSRSDWLRGLGERSAYRAILSPELPLPQALRGSYQGDCEILDGGLDDSGYPAFLVRDYVNGQGSGVAYLSASQTLGEYTQTLTLPGGLNFASQRVAVDWVINSGIKPDDRPWRYEGRPPQGASTVGVLWEDQGLRFKTVPIRN